MNNGKLRSHCFRCLEKLDSCLGCFDLSDGNQGGWDVLEKITHPGISPQYFVTEDFLACRDLPVNDALNPELRYALDQVDA